MTTRTQAQQWLPERSTPIHRPAPLHLQPDRVCEFGVLYRDAGHRRAGADRPGGGGAGARLGMKLHNNSARGSTPPRSRHWRSVASARRDAGGERLAASPFPGGAGRQRRAHLSSGAVALMKPTAYLINTARGRLGDGDALVAAPQNGQIAGAGLDVFPLRAACPTIRCWHGPAL